MTEKEQSQSYRQMPPWRRWLIIAFGLLLPVFFLAVGCSFIIASRAPLWAMAIGLILGLAWGIIWSTSNLFAHNSGKMRSLLGSISAAMLFITLLLTAEWAAIPRHPVSVAFSAGYVFSYAVGLFIGILSFNAVAARLRT
jgi:cation transport ATPase